MYAFVFTIANYHQHHSEFVRDTSLSELLCTYSHVDKTII